MTTGEAYERGARQTIVASAVVLWLIETPIGWADEAALARTVADRITTRAAPLTNCHLTLLMEAMGLTARDLGEMTGAGGWDIKDREHADLHALPAAYDLLLRTLWSRHPRPEGEVAPSADAVLSVVSRPLWREAQPELYERVDGRWKMTAVIGSEPFEGTAAEVRARFGTAVRRPEWRGPPAGPKREPPWDGTGTREAAATRSRRQTARPGVPT